MPSQNRQRKTKLKLPQTIHRRLPRCSFSPSAVSGVSLSLDNHRGRLATFLQQFDEFAVRDADNPLAVDGLDRVVHFNPRNFGV